jgi:hypothetical protein
MAAINQCNVRCSGVAGDFGWRSGIAAHHQRCGGSLLRCGISITPMSLVGHFQTKSKAGSSPAYWSGPPTRADVLHRTLGCRPNIEKTPSQAVPRLRRGLLKNEGGAFRSNAYCKSVAVRSVDKWSYNCLRPSVAPAGDGFDPQRSASTGRHRPMWSRGWQEEKRSGACITLR